MNILSLCDGISAAHLALLRAGIPIDQYFASEINKHCITITQKNFPNTIQLGDIRNININSLPDIDIIIGGTPCQGFSLAGNRKNFDDPRSGLFYCFADLVKRIPHKYFIFENVPMHITVLNEISRTFAEIHPECVLQHEIFTRGKLSPIVINIWKE
jgi:DNA-cytosine methyltransferase